MLDEDLERHLDELIICRGSPTVQREEDSDGEAIGTAGRVRAFPDCLSAPGPASEGVGPADFLLPAQAIRCSFTEIEARMIDE